MDALELRSFSKELEKTGRFLRPNFKAIKDSAKLTWPILGLAGGGAFVYGASKFPSATGIRRQPAFQGPNRTSFERRF